VLHATTNITLVAREIRFSIFFINTITEIRWISFKECFYLHKEKNDFAI